MTAYKELRVNVPFPIRKIVEIGPLTLNKKLSVESFKALAINFPDLRMEREKNGKTTIMSPVKFGTGKREIRISVYLGKWWLENDEVGELFSPSSAIELADTSIKCPDAGWISEERLAQNPVDDEDDHFLKIAPDFIAEVKSKTDSLNKLKNKMVNAWIK
ncbi:MAG: Uma2 family endonuclease, partial [Bacteroidota bacterium]